MPTDPALWELCHPDLARRGRLWEQTCTSRGILVRVISTWRPLEEQIRLWNLGRDPVSGLVMDPARVVTWTKPTRSLHVHVDENGKPCSLAFDFRMDADTNGDGKLSFDEMFGQDLPWGPAITIGVYEQGLVTIARWNTASGRFVGDLGHLQLNLDAPGLKP